MEHKFFDEYWENLGNAFGGLDRKEFYRAVDILTEAYRGGRQIFCVGNGGSAATANHFVCDFGKNAVQDPSRRRFRMISLSDNVEKITAFGNDVAFDEIFRQQMINLMDEGDVLLAISASGNSPDLVRACEYAREKNGLIITVSGYNGGKIREFADASLVAHLESYEQIEDIHMIIMHMFVCWFKTHPESLAAV